MGGPGANGKSDAQARKEAYRQELEAQVRRMGLGRALGPR